MSPLDVPVAFVLLAISAGVTVSWLWGAFKRARADRLDPDQPVPYTPEVPAATCWLDRCDEPDPDQWVYNRQTGWLLVCHRCAVQGTALGWFQWPETA